jgi:hypothetical protein
VARAVEESKADFLKKHPPLTKREAQADLEKRLNDQVQLDRELRKKPNDADRKQKLAACEAETKKIRDRMLAVNRKYVPEIVKPELTRLDFSKLSVGTVGLMNDSRAVRGESQAARCVKIVSPTRAFVGLSTNREVRRGNVVETVRGPETLVLVDELDTGALTEGKPIARQKIPVVVTGVEETQTPEGRLKKLTVLEVFDPEKKFR